MWLYIFNNELSFVNENKIFVINEELLERECKQRILSLEMTGNGFRHVIPRSASVEDRRVAMS